MINALDYINSRDIRKYWEEIDYKASPWETAWLIWQSKKHTLKEKLNAWEIVAKEHYKAPSPFSNSWSKFCTKRITLGYFLQTYINLENDLLEQFYFKGNACFSVSYIRYLHDEWASEPDRVFPSIEAVYKFLDCFCTNDGDYSEEDFKARITKHELGMARDEAPHITLTVNAKKEILSIDSVSDRLIGAGYMELEKRYNLCFRSAFEDMWFNFPVPFRWGDTICNKYWNRKLKLCTGPMIMLDCTYNYCKEHPEYKGRDTTDMNVMGYFQNENGLYYEVADGLMDYEYYTYYDESLKVFVVSENDKDWWED